MACPCCGDEMEGETDTCTTCGDEVCSSCTFTCESCWGVVCRYCADFREGDDCGSLPYHPECLEDA